MKKIFTVAVLIVLACCSKADNSTSTSTSTSTSCGTYNGHTLYKGPQGGCYYIKSNGEKEYVNRSRCRC